MADSSVPDLESKTISLSGPGSEVPAWYPPWAQELAGLYYSGSVCLFLLHGNVHDLIPCVTKKGTEFCSLSEFLVAADVRIVGRRVFLRSRAGVAVGGRAGRQASPGDGGVHVVPAGESQHVAARSGPGAGGAGANHAAKLAGGETGPAQAGRVSLRVCSASDSIGRFEYAGPGRGVAPGAIDRLGAEPVHQAREHGVLPDRQQAVGAQRAAGAEPARGGPRDSAARRSHAQAVHRVIRLPKVARERSRRAATGS